MPLFRGLWCSPAKSFLFELERCVLRFDLEVCCDLVPCSPLDRTEVCCCIWGVMIYRDDAACSWFFYAYVAGGFLSQDRFTLSRISARSSTLKLSTLCSSAYFASCRSLSFLFL